MQNIILLDYKIYNKKITFFLINLLIKLNKSKIIILILKKKYISILKLIKNNINFIYSISISLIR